LGVIVKQENYTAMSIKIWIKSVTWMCEWTGITAYTTGQNIVSDNIIVPIYVPYHNDSQRDGMNQIGNIRSEI
jgi:hypothetical protein